MILRVFFLLVLFYILPQEKSFWKTLTIHSHLRNAVAFGVFFFFFYPHSGLFQDKTKWPFQSPRWDMNINLATTWRAFGAGEYNIESLSPFIASLLCSRYCNKFISYQKPYELCHFMGKDATAQHPWTEAISEAIHRRQGPKESAGHEGGAPKDSLVLYLIWEDMVRNQKCWLPLVLFSDSILQNGEVL